MASTVNAIHDRFFAHRLLVLAVILIGLVVAALLSVESMSAASNASQVHHEALFCTRC